MEKAEEMRENEEEIEQQMQLNTSTSFYEEENDDNTTSSSSSDDNNNNNNTTNDGIGVIINGNGGTNHHHYYHKTEEEEVKINDEEADLGVDDGPASSQKCLYYQTHQGLWKCRTCCWKYRTKNVSSDDIQISKKQLDMVINFNFTRDIEGNVLSTGLSLNGHSGTECFGEENLVVQRLDATIQSVDTGKCIIRESNLHCEEDLKNDSLSGSNALPSEIVLEEEDTSFKASSDTALESEDVNVASEIAHEVKDLDVERVLNEQDTHDLYCPNCNSCITKRVILRKRKRNIQTAGDDLKRNKPEKVIGSEFASTFASTIDDPAHNIIDISLEGNVSYSSNAYDLERHQDVFRCLSCFSIFIPTGNGFKLFRMFGDKKEKQNMQDPQQLPTVKKNWFSSFFSTNFRDLSMEQATSGKADVDTDNIEELINSNLNKKNGETSSGNEALSDAPTYFVGEHVKGKSTESKEHENNNLLPSTRKPIEPGKEDTVEAHISMNVNKQNGLHKAPPHETFTDEDLVHASPNRRANGTQVVVIGEIEDTEIHNSKGGPSLENFEGSVFPKTTLAGKTLIIDGEATENITFIPQQNGGSLLENSEESVFPKTALVGKTLIITGEATENTAFIAQQNGEPSVGNFQECVFPETTMACKTLLIPREATENSTLMPQQDGNDTIIDVETSQTESAAAEDVQGIPVSTVTGNWPQTEPQIGLNEQRGTSTEGIQGMDIIKSIVYGGLVESVTSLGVVSSAAGAGAGTLNVLALGLANLIGGVIVLGHNLWDLKTDHTRRESGQLSEQMNKYQELLGRRKHFVLHAIIAIVSYLVFGLLPPIIYGFSFRTSDDKDLKILVVTAASLLGIIILAIGKAHVKNPPKSKMKTVMYYAVMGLMCSGTSYAVGNLIMRLLHKLGFSESISAVSLPESGSMKSLWASY